MGDRYYVISSSDGDVHIECLSRALLISRLNEEYWGRREFMDNLPDDLVAHEGVWIIQGDHVMPEPVKSVQEWTVP